MTGYPCFNCGEMVSHMATSCPYCGQRLKDEKELNAYERAGEYYSYCSRQ